MKENSFDFKEFLLSTGGKAAMIIVLYFIIWGFMGAMAAIEASFVAVIFAIFLGYFGWGALNRITPDIFLFMSIGGWAIYFLIKGFLSVAIGMFVAPFVIAKKIANSIQNSLR